LIRSADMLYKKAIILVLVIVSLQSPVVKAGDSVSASPVIAGDMSDSPLRMPEKSYFNKYLTDKDYYYGEYKAPKNSGFLYRLWNHIVSILNAGLKAIKYIPVVFRVIFIVLCLVLLYVINTKTKLFKLFYTDIDIPSPEFIEANPLDENQDFDSAINEQISRHNFRNAVRLLHLKLLNELGAHELIRYSKEKTNREYALEINDSALSSSFTSLTGIYNRIWYGNYPLSMDEYKSLASGFYQFSSEINADKK
jgi:hypothetical protein